MGPATAKRLRRQGILPELLPPAFDGDALARSLCESSDLPLGRVLFPCSDIARPTIPEGLRRSGASVDAIVVYATVDATPSEMTLKLIDKGVDAIVFCSPSAVRRFAALGLPVGDATIACIGPTTASVARSAGLRIDVIAEEHSASGIVAVLERHYTADVADGAAV